MNMSSANKRQLASEQSSKGKREKKLHCTAVGQSVNPRQQEQRIEEKHKYTEMRVGEGVWYALRKIGIYCRLL